MRSSWVKRLLLVGAGLAALVALRFTVFEPESIPVTVYRAAAGRVEETVTNSKAGTVKSRRRATLSTEIGGRVAELPAREGKSVKSGEVLLRLSDDDPAAQVALQERSAEAAEASAREACDAAGQADRDLERNRALASQSIVSPSLLEQSQSVKDTARSACEAAKARARQAQAAVKLARVQRDKSTLRAPFDGVIAEISTEVGEWITPSPPGVPIPPVIELIDPAAIYVSAPLDEVDVARVTTGRTVRVTMDAFPGRSFGGKVVRVAPYVLDREEQNRTFEIEVELDDAAFARTLVPGSSADVEVILDAREGVLRVPSYALLEGGRVLVAREGRVVERKVRTGLRNWAFTEVLEGLTAGDAVCVTLDRAEIRDGARVRVEGETDR
ncbi:MAG TPA: efflux RND transporter periplasmic adaptor subunit [Candidatus Polarisedimenticolaceae bacterium]